MTYPPSRRPPGRSRRAPAGLWWTIIAFGVLGPLILVRCGLVPEGPRVEAERVVVTPLPSARQAPAPSLRPTELTTTNTSLTPSPGPTASPIPPLPTPISVPRSSPFGAAPLTPDEELARRVTFAVEGQSGRFGVAIKDLQSGRGLLIDPDSAYPAASLFKLPVMYEVFKQRELGALSFDEVLYFTDRHVAFDLGTLDRPAGSPILLREALERMIVISDNSSAILLTDRVGAFNINQDMAGLGLSRTRLVAEDLVTSPQDMLNFLEMIARGQAVTPKASLEMLQLLGRQEVNDRIPRLLPPGTSVAHKTGNLPGIVNDVGIVSSSDVSFAIAVLVSGTGEEGTTAVTIARVAAAALEYFESVAAPAPTPTLSPPSVTPTPTATREIPVTTNATAAPLLTPAPTASPGTPARVTPAAGSVTTTATARPSPPLTPGR